MFNLCLIDHHILHSGSLNIMFCLLYLHCFSNNYSRLDLNKTVQHIELYIIIWLQVSFQVYPNDMFMGHVTSTSTQNKVL